MRVYLGIFAAAALASASGAAAQDVALNHLDCRFDQSTQGLICPDVLSGRSATSARPVEQADGSGVKPDKGTAEWNAACAGKYKSFDPATGLYRSFSGQMKPCV